MTTQPTSNAVNNAQAHVPIQQDLPVMGMPEDIFGEIFRRVGRADVVVCPSVCKHWKHLFGESVLWRNLLESHFPLYTIPKEIQDFPKAYKDQRLRNYNLKNGVYVSHTLRGHTRTVTFLAISGDKLFSGSGDSTIKIWDLSTMSCLETLWDTYGIISFAISGDGKKLFSSSLEGKIKIWDLSTKTCHKAPFDAGWVTTLAIFGDKLVSGSIDGTIKIWDLSSNACLATLQGGTGPVGYLAVFGDKLISADMVYSNGLKIWDLSTKACLATLPYYGGVDSLAIFGDKLISSGFYDNSIKIWDLSTKTCLVTISRGGGGDGSPLAISGDKLFSGSIDGTIEIFDLSAIMTCLRPTSFNTTTSFKGHADRIRSLAISEGMLISGSGDSTIKIWNFDAKHTVVFEELASLLESGDADLIQQAMDRFSRMPKAAKHQIYGELYQILKPLNLIQNDYWGCAEHAFHNMHGQSSTPSQRAQAIRNYVEKQR